MMDVARCFMLLGVLPTATPDELKRAYYDLVREWHPDQFTHDEVKRCQAETRLKEINGAYEYLETVTPTANFAPWRTGGSGPNGASRAGAYASYSGAATDPEADTETPARRASRLFADGMQDFESGRMRDAVSDLTQSVCLYPNNWRAHLTLGHAHGFLKQPAKAASAYQQALRFEPHSLEAYRGLVDAYTAMGDYRAAATSCAAYMRKYGSVVELLAPMGHAYRMSGRLAQAVSALTDAILLQPACGEAHYELGETYLAAGDVLAAREQVDHLRPLDEDLAMRLMVAIAVSLAVA